MNTEADIESCTVISPEGVVKAIRIENRKITFYAAEGESLDTVKLDFKLTPGAELDAPSEYYNLEKEPRLTVVSEDKQWRKEYRLLAGSTATDMPVKFEFEHAELSEDRYYRFYEVLPGNIRLNIWDSGNEGFKVVAWNKGPDDYPTTWADEGRSGKCAKMVTRGTGFGRLGMPIAAGNLFIGRFNPEAVKIGDPEASLKATEFGSEFNFVPKAVTGWYTYRAGNDFLGKDGKIDPKRKDCFNMYAIVYEPTPEIPFVDGLHQHDSPVLVMRACIRPEDCVETEEWRPFRLPFEPVDGKVMDPEKLKERKYRMSLIFTSSIQGDRFLGAAGSTLMVDDVEIETEKSN